MGMLFFLFAFRLKNSETRRVTLFARIFQCLKLTEKVAFNIASEASYVYMLSGQKFIENAKNCQFWRFLEKPKDCCQIVLPDMSLLI